MFRASIISTLSLRSMFFTFSKKALSKSAGRQETQKVDLLPGLSNNAKSKDEEKLDTKMKPPGGRDENDPGLSLAPRNYGLEQRGSLPREGGLQAQRDRPSRSQRSGSLFSGYPHRCCLQQPPFPGHGYRPGHRRPPESSGDSRPGFYRYRFRRMARPAFERSQGSIP